MTKGAVPSPVVIKSALVVALSLACSWACVGLAALADDRSASRFDSLFSELEAAETPEAAAFIAEEIEALWRASGDPTADLLVDRAIQAEADEEPLIARRLLDGAAELAPDAARVWAESAMLALGQDELSRALSDISRAVEIEPRQYDTLVGLGLILERLEQPAGAFEAYERALEIYPLHPEAGALRDRVREDAIGEDL